MGSIYINRRLSLNKEVRISILQKAVEAAHLGGQILTEGFGKLQKHQIGLKGRGDFITEMDYQSEKAILDYVRQHFPDHGIQAEESGEVDTDSEYKWIVDPLDGTANYVQGIPFFSVSIAVLKSNTPEYGVVYVPMLHEMFTAQKNEGAWLNGEAIHLSDKTDMEQAILSTGFPWRSKEQLQPFLKAFEGIFSQSAGIRRMGSAAIDLAYTACGRFEGFWEMALKPWDISAGVLMVEEVGGRVTDFTGGNTYFQSGNVVAGHPVIHEKMIAVTRQFLGHL